MKNMRQKLITALTAAVACFLLIPTAAADQVIPDDLIVQSSLCVGFDCVNNESFGFDTIRLKENNLRIKAEDTSGGSFPTNDWEITFNESTNGGLSKFSITDTTGAKVPFTIEAGTPSNSLYVDSTHRVGFGTSTPVLDLHVNTSNTPGLRLEQNSTGGFTAQTWDIAGNEANFFVRDVTGGSRLPFRIRPGAPTSSVDISATGNVGIGTASPATDTGLHVAKSGTVVPTFQSTGGGAVQFRLQSDSDTNRRIVGITNGGAVETQIRLDNDAIILQGATDGNRFAFFNSAGLIIEGATCMVSGGGGACDAVFDPETGLESIEEHAEYMWENRHLPAVGPTPEGQKIPFNVHQRHFGLLNELEKAHIYIERLNEKLNAKASQVDDLTERLARLESLVVASAGTTTK